jgi:hypothetical protein
MISILISVPLSNGFWGPNGETCGGVPILLWILGEKIRQEYLRKSYEADDIIFCYGQQSLRFRGWFNGFGSRPEDQRSEDSALPTGRQV